MKPTMGLLTLSTRWPWRAPMNPIQRRLSFLLMSKTMTFLITPAQRLAAGAMQYLAK